MTAPDVPCRACGHVGGPLRPSDRWRDGLVCVDGHACFDRWEARRATEPDNDDEGN